MRQQSSNVTATVGVHAKPGATSVGAIVTVADEE
jgi:hypothetical protein